MRTIVVDCYLRHWNVRYLGNGNPARSLQSTRTKTHGRISFTDLEFETKDAAVDYAIEVAKKMSEYYGDTQVECRWMGAVKEAVLIKSKPFEEPRWNSPRVIEHSINPTKEEDVGEAYVPHSSEINEFGKDIHHLVPRMHAR